jgi:eukaryotic-like serine/threonine-protein kinase
VLLYELLTGRQPYTGETPISVAYQHANSDVPAPSALLPEIPASVDRLVLDATERDPAARPRDAATFLTAVRRVRAELGPSAQPQAWPADRSGPTGLSGLLGVGAKGLAEAPWLDTASSYGTNGWGTSPDARGMPGDTGGFGFAANGGGSHTMVVHRDEAAGYAGRESFLGRWLFSRRLIIVALVFALAVAFGVGGWWYTAGRYTTIPSVAGDTVSQATAALTQNGFRVTTGAQENSNAVAKGQVAGTSPAGRALKGSVVAILVSAGPFTSVVPVVRGDTLAAAKSALAGQHLSTVVEQVGSALPKGTVVGTIPKAGRSWPQTQTVTILVADGPPMPDFVGLQKSAAAQLAANDHLTVTYVTDTNSNQPPGTVVSQSPAKNSLMTNGEDVTLTVSSGVTVPNVIGLGVVQARNKLEAAGFTVVVLGSYFFGTVEGESPDSGSVPPGTTITLNVVQGGGGGGGGCSGIGCLF